MIRGRWVWISAAAIVTAILAIWPDTQEVETISSPRKRSAATRHEGQVANDEQRVRGGAESLRVESLKLENLIRVDSKVEKTNPFAPLSWYRPPPTLPPKAMLPALPEEQVAPVIPTAPPLPFSYMGSYEDGNKRLIMLVRGGQMYTLSEGDNIDNLYRVESIEGNKVDIVYLPLGVTQTIDTGEKVISARKKG